MLLLYLLSAPQLLIIVNPKSGKGNVDRKFKKEIEPFLRTCHIQFKVKVTQGPKNALEIVSKENLDEITAILVVGGDGILFEVIVT